MKKCPRCGLPPEGELECHYCGLVFNDEIKSNNFITKLKTLDSLQGREQILKWFIILIVLLAFLSYFNLSLWLIIPILAIGYVISQANKKSGTKNRLIGAGKKATKENLDWLKDRWERVENEKESGELKTVKQWYLDEATERQLARIKRDGLNIGVKNLTKGQASDLIGLSERPNEGAVEILQFFKVSIKGISETRARDEVAKIFADPNKVKAWKTRPATQMQKEFFRFFNQKLPKGLTSETASEYIRDYEMEHEDDEDILDEWYNYEAIYEDIDDPETRKEYEIKKVSLSVYRKAIDILRSEGKSLTELSSDYDRIIEKIVEIKPEIRK